MTAPTDTPADRAALIVSARSAAHDLLPWLHRSRPGLLPRGSSYTAPRWPSSADVPQREGEL